MHMALKKNNFKIGLISLLLLTIFIALFYFLSGDTASSENEALNEETPLLENRADSNLKPARYRPDHEEATKEEKDDREVISSLSGKVISISDGSPIAGAKLVFALSDGRKFSTSSKGDGSFYFLIYEEGTYELQSISAPHFLPLKGENGTGERFTATLGLDISDIVFTLEPLEEVYGQVINEEHQGVAGAEVWYISYKKPQSAFAVTTGEGGYFTISVPDQSVLEARYKGYKAGRNFYRREILKGEMLIIMLGPNLDDFTLETISGQVLLPDGEPAKGAMVVAHLNQHNPSEPKAPHSNFPDSTYSNEDGYFELANLVAGNYYLSARLDGYQPAKAPQVDSGTSDVELKLASGFTISGQVLDQTTGAPVQSYTVIINTMGSRRPGRSVPVFSADGRYEIGGLSKSRFTITIAASGYAASDERSINPFGIEAATENFELVGGGRVFGQVIDEESGAPIGGAIIRNEGRYFGRHTAGSYHGQSISDNNGHFEFYGLAIGTRSLAVNAPGYNQRLISGLEISPGANIGPLEISLIPLGEGERPALDITGIGAVLGRGHGGGVVVMRVVPGGGAAEAGLKRGDRILAVNGQTVEGRNFNDVVEEVRGPEGSVVTLLVQKGATGEDNEPITLVVPRRRVKA